MTTTHTFHGLNSESRPSSRVLNPPGGSSSNIFGCDSQMKQHSYVRNNQEMVNKERNDTTVQGLPAATAGPQQKSWAPRSGDDSIHTSFGIYPSSRCDKAPGNIRVNLLIPGVQNPRIVPVERYISSTNYYKADTFRNIFGEDTDKCTFAKYRKMFRKINNVNDDSFSRVFGQKSLLDCRDARQAASFLSISASKHEMYNYKSGDARDMPLCGSNSVFANIAYKPGNSVKASHKVLKLRSEGGSTKTIPIFRRFPLDSAFNPITGEVYEQPKPKSEPVPPSAQASSVSNNIHAPEAVEPVTETASTLDAVMVQPEPAEPAVVEPAAVAEPPVPEKPQPTQSGRLFGGGSDNVKEHRSTRVSQPPGGHSSKLW